MDLWKGSANSEIEFSELQKDIETEVIIIGAGISGAFMAEELSGAGFDCVVLDKRDAPFMGSTKVTTALLQYEIDVPLTKMQELIPPEDAARVWRRSQRSLNNLAAKINSLDISCDFQKKDGLYLSGNVLNTRGLKREWAARNAIGLETDYIRRKELQEKYGLEAAAAIVSHSNYAANPFEMASGFLHKAVERGVQVFAPCKAVDVNPTKDNVVVKTNNGHRVKSKHVVYTSGYEVPLVLNNQIFRIASTWVFATQPQKENLTKEVPLIWEASDPYLYIRETKEGRIICGGEDEPYGNAGWRDNQMERKIKILQEKLHKRMPGIDPIPDPDYKFAGSFAITPNGLPLIGQIPKMPRCYAVLAFGGNGITFSRIGAEMICNSLKNKRDPDTSLFQLRIS